MRDFCILTGFENIVSKIELDRSSLACKGTKHRTRYLKRFHSTTTHASSSPNLNSLRISNIDTKTNGIHTINDDVKLFKER